MDFEYPRCRGVYVLILHLPRPYRLRVGKLGPIYFEPGYYAYVGSGRGSGGVGARIKRHFEGSGRMWWHIDYLRRIASPLAAVYHCGGLDEASVVDKLSRELEPYARGFGSSDTGRWSHLFKCESNCVSLVQGILGPGSHILPFKATS